jgi:hypothetical protein
MNLLDTKLPKEFPYSKITIQTSQKSESQL